MSKEKLFNLNYPNDLAEAHRILFEEEDVFDFSDEDEGENEEMEVFDYDSSSEQEIDDSDEELQVSSDNDDYCFYIGKDDENIWKSTPITEGHGQKVNAKNIMKRLPGPIRDGRKCNTELDSFLTFITIDMIDDIVRCTNKFIQQKRLTVEYLRDRDCQDTSRTEVMALFGILYLLATKKGNRANITEFWYNDGTGLMMCRATFSYKRFRFLMRALRFDDITTRNQRAKNDKLAAIRQFHSSFIQNCRNNYSLSEYVTIDEMLHPFRGRCSFIQYMPAKPAKYGLKLYAICDSNTYYTYDFEIYCGKQLPGPYAASNKPEDIVKRLTKSITKTNPHLTTDNYYTSYPLAKYLLENGITTTGTLKKNKREIPPEFLLLKNRSVGSTMFGFQYDVSLVSYKTKINKAVLLLSTMHDTNEIDPDTGKSLIVLDYNKYKDGVNTVDQKCSLYSTARNTRRWPLSLFLRHLDLAGINANVIFTANCAINDYKDRRFFLKDLSFALLECHLKNRALIKSLPKDIYLFLDKYREQCVIEPPAEDIRKGPCLFCGKHKNIKTGVRCSNCKVFVCKNHCVKNVLCESCNNV